MNQLATNVAVATTPAATSTVSCCLSTPRARRKRMTSDIAAPTSAAQKSTTPGSGSHFSDCAVDSRPGLVRAGTYPSFPASNATDTANRSEPADGAPEHDAPAPRQEPPVREQQQAKRNAAKRATNDLSEYHAAHGVSPPIRSRSRASTA